MKLTEEQREIALRAVDLVLSNLADRSFDVRVCDEDVVEDIRQSLAIDIATIYTEAPIAPSASEQKPVAYMVSIEGEPDLGHWFAETNTAVPGVLYKPLYTAPQPGYKAQRDSERIDWLASNPIEALDIFGQIRTGEEQYIRNDIDAAIASAKGEKRCQKIILSLGLLREKTTTRK